jgi:hypothetical protein
MYSMTTPEQSSFAPHARYRCAGGISGTSLPDSGNTSKVEQPPEEDKEASSDVSVSGTQRSSGRRKGSRRPSSPVLKYDRR